jgi:opacity protein-like surface antigen
MFYSKVGAAWSRHEYGLALNGQGTYAGFGPPPAFTFFTTPAPFGFAPTNVSERLLGWTVGTGVKWAISNSWFLNVEYDYMDFGSKGQNFSAACVGPPAPAGAIATVCAPIAGAPPRNPSTFSPTFNSHISQVKVGLNYKFPSGFLFW